MTTDLTAALRGPAWIAPDLATLDALVDGTITTDDLEPAPAFEDESHDCPPGIGAWTSAHGPSSADLTLDVTATPHDYPWDVDERGEL